jgi:hypothetical protein
VRLFVARRVEEIPDGCTHFASVDGSVPGAAVTWDHHVTGEAINLDAMPDVIDPTAFDGVATTLTDTDAVASAVVLLLGGAACVPGPVLSILRAASHWCDHLLPHPDEGEEANRIGRGVDRYVADTLHRNDPQEGFGLVVEELVARIRAGEALPMSDPPPFRDVRALLSEHGAVALFDLRGLGVVPPEVAYAQTECPVAVFAGLHPDGGPRYTVGVNPRIAPHASIRPALEALARAEYALGPPALGPEPIPGNETWGGRDTVGGSPWNYGSRLPPDEVVAIVVAALMDGGFTPPG